MKLGLLFWPEISTSLWDPLGCSDLSQIFLGSSLGATEWDKTVAEIIYTTFVFLGHPNLQFEKLEMLVVPGIKPGSLVKLYCTQRWNIARAP